MPTKHNMTRQLDGAELFSTGTWNDMPFAEGDLDNIVSAFDALGLAGRVPLKLGHEGADARDDPTSQFALGWVKKIWRDGTKLKGNLELPDKVHAAVKEGFLKNVSIELLKNVKAGTRVLPWVLDAVALLGADQPAVGVLKDLQLQALTMSRVARLEHGARVAFRRETNGRGDHMTPEEEARMKKLESAVETFSTKMADKDKELEKERDARKKDKAEFRRKEIKLLFDAAIGARQILPRTYEKATKYMNLKDDDKVLDITDADVASFIADHKDLDAPQIKKNAAGGAREDKEKDEHAEDKGQTNAQVFTRRTQQEALRVGDKLTDWRAMDAAARRVMRTDKALADAYLNDPQGEYQATGGKEAA